jgi:hypothetical protein
MTHRPINILVYGDDSDLLLAREAQGLGAFYESRTSILNSLAGYLASALPPNDRRNAAVRNRRTMFRGGRRSADVAHNHATNVRQPSRSAHLHVRSFHD